MLAERSQDQTAARRQLIADGLAEVGEELRLIDVVDFATFIRCENHPNLNDLVDSSVELYFAPGVLTYSWGAEADMRWDRAPRIKLDMEFRNLGVTVFFQLVVEACGTGVELNYVSFDPRSPDPSENTARLAEAVARARRAPVLPRAAEVRAGDPPPAR